MIPVRARARADPHQAPHDPRLRRRRGTRTPKRRIQEGLLRLQRAPQPLPEPAPRRRLPARGQPVPRSRWRLPPHSRREGREDSKAPGRRRCPLKGPPDSLRASPRRGRRGHRRCGPWQHRVASFAAGKASARRLRQRVQPDRGRSATSRRRRGGWTPRVRRDQRRGRRRLLPPRTRL